MAKNKSPRKPKAKPVYHRRAHHVNRAVRRTLTKFQVIGDKNHRPTAFHFAELHMHLKGTDLRVGIEKAFDFLCHVKQPWTMMTLHFFEREGVIDVIPVTVIYPDTTLLEMGANGEDFLKDARDSVFDQSDEYTEEDLKFYGYIITFGDDLNMDKIEEQLTVNFLKITKDLTDLKDHTVELNGQKVLDALYNDKFSLADRNALKTQYSLKG